MAKIRLKDIADVITKGTTPTSIGFDFCDSGINFVKIESISEDGGFIPSKFAHISEDCDKKLARSQLKENDILFSIAGAIGRTAIVNKDILPANTNQALAIIRVPKGKLDYSYLLYALNSPDLVKQFEKQKQGVAQLNLSLQNVGDFSIPIKSWEEQLHIVSVLNKVHHLLYYRKQQLAKLDELVKARFMEMFDEPFSMAPLNQVCTFIDYRGKTPEKSDFGIPLITAKNVRENSFSIEPQEFIPEENYERVMTRGIPKANDVLFTTEAPLGNVCRIPNIYKLFCVGQRIITMQPSKGTVTSEYLEFALRDRKFQDKMWEKSSGSTVKGIRSKLLEWLTIPVPPYDLQCRFSKFVQQTDKQKLTIQQSLDKLEVLKKSLMQEYFG